jgi:hypothetical protein
MSDIVKLDNKKNFTQKSKFAYFFIYLNHQDFQTNSLETFIPIYPS